MTNFKSFPALVKKLRSPISRAFSQTHENPRWENGIVPYEEWKALSNKMMGLCDRLKLPYEYSIQPKFGMPPPYDQKTSPICMHAAALTSLKVMGVNKELDLLDLVDATGEPIHDADDNHRLKIHKYIFEKGARILNSKGRVHASFEGLPNVGTILMNISQNIPVVAGFDCDGRFDILENEIYMGELSEDEDEVIGHEVCLSAYAVSLDHPPYMSFINSYGPEFGVDGVGKVYMGVPRFGRVSFSPKLVKYTH